MLRSAVPHRSENHGEPGISIGEKARIINPEAPHKWSRARSVKSEARQKVAVFIAACLLRTCCSLWTLQSPVHPKLFCHEAPRLPRAPSLPAPANRSRIAEASPLSPGEISAAHSDCSPRSPPGLPLQQPGRSRGRRRSGRGWGGRPSGRPTPRAGLGHQHGDGRRGPSSPRR